MESYEDDDDTHFCIKCHLTIHGLDNYVRHRQSGCRPPDDKNVAVRVSPTTAASPTTVFYPEILNADAFFSSLELQSSSKSNPRKASGLLEESRKFKKDDKRKKSQKSQVDADESTVKEKLHNMLPGVSELENPTDHLCMPSLVGFPDIVPSTSNKPTVASNRNKLSQSMNNVATNIDSGGFSVKPEPENSLEGLMTSQESKQSDRKRQEESQRIEQAHQTWLEYTILAELATNNENKDLTRYEYEYQQDEDSEDDILEEDLGEDDSYFESDDGEDRERPPRGHIGGKWKPELDDLPQNMSQLQEDDVEPEDEHQEHPPPTYTGGKWRPSDASQVRNRRNCFIRRATVAPISLLSTFPSLLLRLLQIRPRVVTNETSCFDKFPLASRRRRKSTRLRATSDNHRQDTHKGNGYRARKRISNQDIGAVLAAGNLPLDWSTTGIFSLICTLEGASEKSMAFFARRVPPTCTH